MDKRRLVHTVFLFLLPLVVAWYGLSLAAAAGLVILMLAWRWMLSLSTFMLPARMPALELETISASHFVEKVRWNMDVAGLDYTERAAGGTLGAFFLGRTVPRLNIRTGAVRSQIGNSPEILRYLWGAYRAPLGERVSHLEPTAARTEFEQRIDRYGVSLQVWIYFHLLEDRKLSLRAWGAHARAVPVWQRWLLHALFPLLAFLIRRSFRITPANVDKARQRIAELLDEVEASLGDGRASILGGDTLNYTDYAFAAMTGLWLQPEAYGGGRADDVRIVRSEASDAMRADVERWCEDYPATVAWVERLYAERRASKAVCDERAKDAA